MTNHTDGVSFPKDTCMEKGSPVSRRREDRKLVLLNGKTRHLLLCQVHLVSNLMAAADGRKNKDRSRCQATCHC
ncbi:hypothetical protein TNCT_398451 [Trichonephila clavata]|uniref:Uncharacterized protein n=1 Tax=Trichonephila clavata TaxID=2740835 RepID=A0A8X6HK66_TRICU|nr:hypothetical protein TNCT_398451 [Trichonephila clavata]